MKTRLGRCLRGWRLGLCLAGLVVAGVLAARLTLRAEEPGEFPWPFHIGAQSPEPQPFSFPAALAAAEAETGMDLRIVGPGGAWGEAASQGCPYLVPLGFFGGAEPPPQIPLAVWCVLSMGGYAQVTASQQTPGWFAGTMGGFAVYVPGAPVLAQWGSQQAPDPALSAGLAACFAGGGGFLGNAYAHVSSPDFPGQPIVDNAVSSWKIEGLVRYVPTAPPNQPPTARASADKTVVAVGQPVQFRGDQSTDPENQPLTYWWEFGDGATSADVNPTHTYLEPKTYAVRLTVHDPQSGLGTATVSVMAVGVSFDKNPVVVGVSETKATTVTAAISPAEGFSYVSFATGDKAIATVNPTTAASAAQRLTVSGVKKGVTVLEARVNGAVCGSTVIKVGFVDFVRITPDPGYLVPGERTTFTAVGFAAVQGYPPLPGSYSPDLTMSVGTVVVAAIDGKETRGVFLGPVPVNWRLEGGREAEAFIPAGVLKEDVPSVQVEASLEAEGDITPDLHCVMPDGAADTGKLFTKAEVDIDMDIDRDGKVDDDKDEANEVAIGSLLIADKDGVYDDKDEPALRREVVLRGPAGQKVRLVRNSANLRLFKNDKPGKGEKDLFGGKDQVSIEPGSYWLQAGSEPSKAVRDHSLQVLAEDKDGAKVADEIKITVLWVEIKGHNGLGGTKTEFGPENVYDAVPLRKASYGHIKLGVQRSTGTGTAEPATYVRGCIQIDGEISPTDMLDFDKNKKITSGFVEPGPTGGDTAKAEFGFIFRRVVTRRVYSNGDKDPIRVLTFDNASDDSYNAAQDDDPNTDNKRLFIADGDAPSTRLTGNRFFRHARSNYSEHIVFNFLNREPERCSAKLKWAFTGDIALGTNDKAIFILSLPNDDKSANEVLVGAHLDDLKLTLDAPKITKIDNKTIKRGQDVVVTVEGENLVGTFTLKKGGANDIPATKVQVVISNEDKQFSDLKKVKVTFNTSEQPDVGYKLIVENAGGKADEAGFEIAP